METTSDRTNARERILETAAELFFHQGYRATGINEVIAKSGVAKATFYNHFPTKDDLCLAYLQERNTLEYDNIVAYIDRFETPKGRFLGIVEALEPWLETNALRGCAFLNMVAEVPDPDNRLRRTGVQHYDMVRGLIRDLARELIASDPEEYGSLAPDALADDYMVILAGAIAMAEVYHDLEPVRQAELLVRRLIE